MAAATPVMDTSPRPFAPALLKVKSGSSMNSTSMEPISAFTGSTYSARSALRKPPKRGSTSLASRRADSPDHAAAHLALGRPRTHHPAAIGDADHARHPDAPRIRLNPHFDEVRDIAEGDVIAIDWAADRGQARAQPCEDGVRLPRRLPLGLDLERGPARGLEDLRRRAAGYIAAGQFGQRPQHGIGCVNRGRDRGSRAPGAGGEMLWGGTSVSHRGHHLLGRNAELA